MVRYGTEGFAQIIVIAGLLVVSGVVLVATATSFQSSSRAAKVIDQLTDEITASAAIENFLTSALRHNADTARSVTSHIGGTAVILSFESDGGKINPLSAPKAVIDTYIAHLGDASPDSVALWVALTSARETLDGGGAMRVLYRFLIPALSSTDIDTDFSTNNPSAGVDPRYATQRVLSALPDVSGSDVADILAERTGTSVPISVRSAYFTSAVPRYTVVASVTHIDGDAYTERVPIEITSAGSVVFMGRLP